MSNRELFLTYLRHYARKDLAQVSAMFADDIRLRDWNISVSGKSAAVSETEKNFASADSIEIRALAIHESPGSVAGELRILVDQTIELYVVDVAEFDSGGKITAIRAYLGRSDQ